MKHWNGKRRIMHPDWVSAGFKANASSMRLYELGSLPRSIEVPMVVTPLRQMLRGVYGSDWTAARILMGLVIRDTLINAQGALWRFWRYKVLLKSQERDVVELMEQDQ